MNTEATIEEYGHHFLHGLKNEYKGNKEAAFIVKKYLIEGEISVDEEHVLKAQLVDSLKIVGIGIPFVLVPGASVLMPILMRVADKHNI